MEFIFALILVGFMLVVMVYDARFFIIPNWLNLALFAIFPAWYFLSPTELDIVSSLLMFGALLGIGFAMFAVSILGGGDVKLLAVLGLYVGWTKAGIGLLMYMALLGGALSVIVLALRIMLRHRDKEKVPRILRHKEPFPYGLAIAGGFLILMFSHRVPGFTEVDFFGFL